MYIDAYWTADVVFCVDKSSHELLAQVGTFIEEFCERALESMEFVDKQIQDFRIKIIAYGDLSSSAFDISPFFNYFDDKEKMSMFDFLNSIEVERLGGNGTVDALEALASAINSNWTDKGTKRRQVIVMLNRHECSLLGAHKSCKHYPQNMPDDIDKLWSWWEGTNTPPQGSYDRKAGRLIAIAPDEFPWHDLQALNRYWPAFLDTEYADDIGSMMDGICGGF